MLLQRKTKMGNRASGLYVVRKCAENIPQKVKWDTPKGEMGYPKRRNGTSQMVVWGMRKVGVPGNGTRVQRWSFGV